MNSLLIINLIIIYRIAALVVYNYCIKAGCVFGNAYIHLCLVKKYTITTVLNMFIHNKNITIITVIVKQICIVLLYIYSNS